MIGLAGISRMTFCTGPIYTMAKADLTPVWVHSQSAGRHVQTWTLQMQRYTRLTQTENAIGLGRIEYGFRNMEHKVTTRRCSNGQPCTLLKITFINTKKVCRAPSSGRRENCTSHPVSPGHIREFIYIVTI